jgi:hypothetical protein
MRTCELDGCGGSLEGRRPDARFCSSSCRREACRLRRLEADERDGHYVTLEHYRARQRRRANYGEEH